MLNCIADGPLDQRHTLTLLTPAGGIPSRQGLLYAGFRTLGPLIGRYIAAILIGEGSSGIAYGTVVAPRMLKSSAPAHCGSPITAVGKSLAVLRLNPGVDLGAGLAPLMALAFVLSARGSEVTASEGRAVYTNVEIGYLVMSSVSVPGLPASEIPASETIRLALAPATARRTSGAAAHGVR
jgi:hypothetical protein